MKSTMTHMAKRMILVGMLLSGVAGCGDSPQPDPEHEIAADLARKDTEVLSPREIVFADTGRPEISDVGVPDLRPDEAGADVWTPTPCAENSDCASDYCLQVNPATGESFCTEPCVEDCPGNWECKLVYFNPPDLVSLCVPPMDTLCAVCDDNGDCLFAGALCVKGEELYGYCSMACAGTEDCPDGFACTEVVIDELPAKQCLPADGTCCESGQLSDCNDGNPCTTEGCHPTLGCVNDPLDAPCEGDDPCMDYWCQEGACAGTPITGDFTRDGIDDDCDGMTDEEALTNLSVVGHVWASGSVSCQDGGFSLGATLGGKSFMGETSDGTYVIRSGLPQAWIIKE